MPFESRIEARFPWRLLATLLNNCRIPGNHANGAERLPLSTGAAGNPGLVSA